MCGTTTRTKIIPIKFSKPKFKVPHKYKEPLNINRDMRLYHEYIFLTRPKISSITNIRARLL